MDITNSKEVSDLIPSAKPKEVYSLQLFIALPKKILIRI